MGKDMYAAVEYLDNNPAGEPFWSFVSLIKLPRDDFLFGALDVWCEDGVPPIAAQRGTPEDICVLSHFHLENYEESRTWVLLSELLAYDWTFVPGYEDIISWLCTLAVDRNKVRIIFGADQ